MASLFGNVGKFFGKAIDVVGGALGNPVKEFGISEKLQGFPVRTASASTQQVLPAQTKQGAIPPGGFGELLNQSPSTSGGGGGGGIQAPQGDSGGGQSLEGSPGQPQLDFGAINEALSTLQGLEDETRSLLGGGEKLAEKFQSSAEAQAQQGREKGISAVGAQERKTEATGQEAETQQRRGFQEISQQFLGRFGRSGFGQGVTGALGESTLQNIGKIRSAVQETVQQLFTQKQEIETQFNTAVEQAQFQAEQLKGQAKSALQSALSEIGSRRVALQSQKADLVNNALENYRQQVVSVNARNAQFQQSIDLAKFKTDEAIREAQSRASNVMNNLASFSLSPGETKILPLSQLGGADAGSQFAGTQLPGGTQFSQAGSYGIFSAPGQENNKTVNIGGVTYDENGNVVQ